MNTGEKIFAGDVVLAIAEYPLHRTGRSGPSMLIARTVLLSLDGLCPLFPQPVSFELGGLFHTLMNRI